jgi:hypothetical protein
MTLYSEKLALLAELHNAKARLAEYEDAHRITVNDCGAPDEQHCSCVPSLRLEAKRLQERLAEATGLLRRVRLERERDAWIDDIDEFLRPADSASEVPSGR